MEIYVDILFTINFIMDFMILWVVKVVSRNNAGIKRVALGAFIGAFLMCLLLFIPSSFYNFIGYVGISVVLILVTFKIKTFKEFAKLFLLTYLVAVCIGGTCIAIFYYTSWGSMLGNLFIYGLKNFSFKLLLVATIISFMMMKLFMNWYGKFIFNNKKLFQLEIYINDKVIETKGLVDTGNSLEDPFSNMPVVIVESTQLKDILSNQLLDIICSNQNSDLNLLAVASKDSELSTRIRIIPFSSIGKENGMLIGFRPDFVTLHGIKDTKRIDEVVVAIANKALAKDGSYHALIHPALID